MGNETFYGDGLCHLKVFLNTSETKPRYGTLRTSLKWTFSLGTEILLVSPNVSLAIATTVLLLFIQTFQPIFRSQQMDNNTHLDFGERLHPSNYAIFRAFTYL